MLRQTDRPRCSIAIESATLVEFLENEMSGNKSLKSKAFNSIVYVSVFFSGAVTMSLEMLIGRTLIPYLGGTIYSWGALIAVFLTGMTLGYLIGGRLADHFRSLIYIGILFVAASGLIVGVPLSSYVVINRVLDHVDDMRFAALFCCLCFAFAPAVVLAAISPAGLRLVMVSRERSGTVSGHISALATFGSIGGTLLTSFYLIPTIGTRSIYFGLAGATLGTGVCLLLGPLLVKLASLMRQRSVTQLSLFALAAGLPAMFVHPTMGQQNQSLKLLKDGLVEQSDSEYNTIFIEKHANLLYLTFGLRRNWQIESILDLDDLSALPIIYTRYMSVAAAYVPGEISRIVMIGLGGGSTISYLVNSMPNSVADVAELNPAVIRLAQTYFDVKETERLHIFNRDGRVFLARTKEQYDLVLIDAYRGAFVPFHLTTLEFYKLAKSHLRPGGVIVQNVDPTTLFFDSTYATMKVAFNNVDAYQADNNVVLIGYDGPVLSDQDLMKRAAELQAKYRFRYDLPQLLRARQTHLKVTTEKVLTDDFAPVEMLKTIK